MSGIPPRKRSRRSKNFAKLPLGCANPSASEDPLTNYVILHRIFSYLNNADLESCCQVNKCWNSIADPLFVRRYQVTLEKSYKPSKKTKKRNRVVPDGTSVSIYKPSTYDSVGVEHFTKTLKAGTEFFQAASQTHKIAIDCLILKWDENEEATVDFLLKIGQFVEKLSVSIREGVTTRRFCELLARCFPNLPHLDLTLTVFKEPDDLYFDENVMENRLKSLKRIDEYEDNNVPGVQSWINIFRMAPNLQEIQGFPILRVDALVVGGKGHCVKYLQYPADEAHEEFRAALEKLANLELKLTSFDFYCDGVWSEFFCTADAELEPFVRRMLESSRETLQEVSLYKTETFDFEAISPLNAVKAVNFMLPRTDQDCQSKFFSPETILSNVFPKASSVKILDELSGYPVSRIANWFPETQFASWGIRKLEITNINLDILHVISGAFPALTHLDLRMGDGGLQRLIPAVSDCWPEIEFLTIRAPGSSEYRAREDGWSFDSVFTGIPKKELVLFGGTDPLVWDTLFSSKKLENWKKGSPLRKISKLKMLKFDLTNENFDLKFGSFWAEKFMERLSAVTLVSKEFCFQFLPELKIVVRTNGTEDIKWHTGMKSRLESVVNFKLETL